MEEDLLSKNWRIARELKDESSDLIKNNNIGDALVKLHQALLYVKACKTDSSEMSFVTSSMQEENEKKEKITDQVLALEKALLSNLCFCLLKKSELLHDEKKSVVSLERVVTNADKALALSTVLPELNDKIRYRKAQALFLLKRYDDANEIVKILRQSKANDAGVRELIIKLNEALKKQKEEQQKMSQRMFK